MSNKRNISASWTKHITDPAEKKKFEEFVRSSYPVLDVFVDILDEKRSARGVFKEEDYKSASWAYEAADRNGYLRALTDVINILTIPER